MKNPRDYLPDLILRLDIWHRKNKRGVSTGVALCASVWPLTKFIMHLPYLSEGAELLLKVGAYVSLAAIFAWLMFFINPLFAQYIRRRQEGQSVQKAMLFDANHCFTGSVMLDAVIFFLVIVAGVVGVTLVGLNSWS